MSMKRRKFLKAIGAVLAAPAAIARALACKPKPEVPVRVSLVIINDKPRGCVRIFNLIFSDGDAQWDKATIKQAQDREAVKKT